MRSITLPEVFDQLYLRSSEAAYLDKDGLLKWAATDVMREATYTPDGKARGFLSEDNIFNYAPYYTSSATNGTTGQWTAISEGVITEDQGVAPDGTTSALLLEDSGIGGSQLIAVQLSGITLPAVGYFVFSAFVKLVPGSGSRYVSISQNGFTGTTTIGNARFDLVTGTVVQDNAAGAEIEAYPNGWFRIYMAGTPDAADLIGQMRVNISDAGTVTGTADGTQGIYVWGMQVERLDTGPMQQRATSLIRTTGGVAVERAADRPRGTFANIYNFGSLAELTVFCEFEMPQVDPNLGSTVALESSRVTRTTGYWSINITMNTGVVAFRILNSSNVIFAQSADVTPIPGEIVKVAAALKDGAFRFRIVGDQSGVLDDNSTDADSGLVTTLEEFSLGCTGDVASNFNSWVRKVKIWGVYKGTDAELEEICGG